MRIGALTIALVVILSPGLAAQNDADLRARVAQILAQAGDRPLPRGDTLVSFAKQGPILYFTVASTADSVASSMVRNDGLVGWATSSWSTGRLTAFSARWATPQGIQVDIEGRITESAIELRGGKGNRLAIPGLPWGVADYGMEDQLVPLLRTLPHDRDQPIAVWRPFGQKWDTVMVRTRIVSNILVVSQGSASWAITPGGGLLFQEDKERGSQRRPLRGSAQFADYQRVAGIIRQSP